MRKHKKLITYILSAAMVMSLGTGISYADDEIEDESVKSQLNSLNVEKEEATRKRINAQNKVAQLKEEQAAVIEEKMALEERNEAAAKEIKLIEDEIDLLEKEIELFQTKIEKKEEEVEKAKHSEEDQWNKYCVRLRAMEENGSYNILAVILNSDDFPSLLAALDDMGEVMESDQRLYNQLQDAREEHERIEEEYIEYKAECEEEKQKNEDSKKQLEEEKAELEKEIEESQALIDDTCNAG